MTDAAPRRVRREHFRSRIPTGARLVTRPSRWANPFRCPPLSRAQAVALFRGLLAVDSTGLVEEIRRELRGHDLACYCPLDGPCHADVLLEVANSGAPIPASDTVLTFRFSSRR